MTMLTLHHLNNSRSQKIVWLLEELELDYRLECYQRDPEQVANPAQGHCHFDVVSAPLESADG